MSHEPGRDLWWASRLASRQGKLTAHGGERAESDLPPCTMSGWERWTGTEGQAQGVIAKRFRDLPRPWGRGSASDVCPSGPAQRRREECTPAAQPRRPGRGWTAKHPEETQGAGGPSRTPGCADSYAW